MADFTLGLSNHTDKNTTNSLYYDPSGKAVNNKVELVFKNNTGQGFSIDHNNTITIDFGDLPGTNANTIKLESFGSVTNNLNWGTKILNDNQLQLVRTGAALSWNNNDILIFGFSMPVSGDKNPTTGTYNLSKCAIPSIEYFLNHGIMGTTSLPEACKTPIISYLKAPHLEEEKKELDASVRFVNPFNMLTENVSAGERRVYISEKSEPIANALTFEIENLSGQDIKGGELILTIPAGEKAWELTPAKEFSTIELQVPTKPDYKNDWATPPPPKANGNLFSWICHSNTDVLISGQGSDKVRLQLDHILSFAARGTVTMLLQLRNMKNFKDKDLLLSIEKIEPQPGILSFEVLNLDNTIIPDESKNNQIVAHLSWKTFDVDNVRLSYTLEDGTTWEKRYKTKVSESKDRHFVLDPPDPGLLYGRFVNLFLYAFNGNYPVAQKRQLIYVLEPIPEITEFEVVMIKWPTLFKLNYKVKYATTIKCQWTGSKKTPVETATFKPIEINNEDGKLPILIRFELINVRGTRVVEKMIIQRYSLNKTLVTDEYYISQIISRTGERIYALSPNPDSEDAAYDEDYCIVSADTSQQNPIDFESLGNLSEYDPDAHIWKISLSPNGNMLAAITSDRYSKNRVILYNFESHADFLLPAFSVEDNGIKNIVLGNHNVFYRKDKLDILSNEPPHQLKAAAALREGNINDIQTPGISRLDQFKFLGANNSDTQLFYSHMSIEGVRCLALGELGNYVLKPIYTQKTKLNQKDFSYNFNFHSIYYVESSKLYQKFIWPKSVTPIDLSQNLLELEGEDVFRSYSQNKNMLLITTKEKMFIYKANDVGNLRAPLYQHNIALFPDHLGISSGGVKKIDLLRYYHEKIPASANADNHLLHVGKTAADTDWTDWYTTTYLINAYCSNEYPEYQSFTCFDPGNSGNEYLVVYHIPKSAFHYQNKWLSINDLLIAYVKAVGKEKAGDLGIMIMYKDFALVSAAIWYYYQQHPIEADKKYWAFFTGGSKVENNLYWYEVCVMEAPAKGMVRSVPNILLAGAYNQAFENENIPRVGPSNFDPPIDRAHQALVGRASTIWGWGPYGHEKGIIISLPTWTYEETDSAFVAHRHEDLLKHVPPLEDPTNTVTSS